MKRYRRRGRGQQPEVAAIQIARPYRAVLLKFPRAHLKAKPSGRLDYIRLIDAPEGSNRGRDGDWIVKHLDGKVEVITAEVFAAEYRPADQAASTDAADKSAASSSSRSDE